MIVGNELKENIRRADASEKMIKSCLSLWKSTCHLIPSSSKSLHSDLWFIFTFWSPIVQNGFEKYNSR